MFSLVKHKNYKMSPDLVLNNFVDLKHRMNNEVPFPVCMYVCMYIYVCMSICLVGTRHEHDRRRIQTQC
jgi:hypothetical protein